MREPDDKLIRADGHGLEPAARRGAGQPYYLTEPAFDGGHLRDYLRVVVKYRLTVLLFVLVTVLTVAVVSLRLPKRYEAVTRLAIDRESPTRLAQESSIPQDTWGFQDYLRTQVEVMESETLAGQTIRRLRLDREPAFAGTTARQEPAAPLPADEALDPATESRLIGRLLAGLEVETVPDSWMIEIRFRSTDPELAARVANAHADNFMEHNFRTKYETTMRASEWLNDQLRELRARVEESEERLVAFEHRYNLVAVNEKENVMTQRLSDLNRELSAAESDRVTKEARLRQAEAGQDPSVLEDSLVSKLESQLSELETQRAESRPQFGPQHPRMKRLDDQIVEVKEQIEERKETILAKLRSEYQEALKREALLRELVGKQKARVNQLNQHLVQYNILKREAETNKDLYEGLLQQLEEAGISAGLRSSNIRVMDPARVPTAPSSPGVFLNVIMALLLSLPVGVALAFFREYLDNTVKTPDEVERYSALPTLATVPAAGTLPEDGMLPAGSSKEKKKAPDDASVALTTYWQPRSGMAEAFRSLRTSILLSFPERPPRVLLVTSGQPTDGKTVTAINLAVALAQRGDKILLVDADLRKPCAHRFLETTGDQGLSVYLSGGRLKNGPIVPTAIPNLSLLPAGPVPPNPAELLSSDRMKELLDRLAREYDHIVLDSPPVLSVTDATVLSVLVDGVVIVVHSGRTTREVLRHVRQMFAGVNARVLGVVLNQVDMRSVDYNYYYYKYYGYGYQHEHRR